jgi:hypothetical protein
MKASLLSSLAYHPELVVLDEPFTGLDPLVREELIGALLEGSEDRPRTVLVSSHDIDEIERLADWIGFIDRGRMLFAEPVSSILTRFRLVEVIATAATRLPARSWSCSTGSGRAGARLVSERWGSFSRSSRRSSGPGLSCNLGSRCPSGRRTRPHCRFQRTRRPLSSRLREALGDAAHGGAGDALASTWRLSDLAGSRVCHRDASVRLDSGAALTSLSGGFGVAVPFAMSDEQPERVVLRELLRVQRLALAVPTRAGIAHCPHYADRRVRTSRGRERIVPWTVPS